MTVNHTDFEIKCRRLSRLQDGWRYGEGKAPSEENIQSAKRFNKSLADSLNLQSYKTDIFSGVNGEVTVEVYIGLYTAEVTFKKQNKVSCDITVNNEYIEEIESTDTNNIINFLKRIETN